MCAASPAATPASPVPQTPSPVARAAAAEAAPAQPRLPWDTAHLRLFLRHALARLVRLHPQCEQVLAASKPLDLALELFK